MVWDDSKYIGFDLETTGVLPEYALQPWRYNQCLGWVTSAVWAYLDDTGRHVHKEIYPSVSWIEQMLDHAIETGKTIVGWNVDFDIAWLFAMGLGAKVLQVRWLDAMRLWRHMFIEPEYENRHNRKAYRLKEAVREFLPQHGNYEEGIDFHGLRQPREQLLKLEAYNVRDVVFTLMLAKMFWSKLQDAQRTCALIEARSLPHLARANYEGMVVDQPVVRELQQHLVDVAESQLKELAPHGMTEKIVRSPVQLSALMFDDWGLPVLKTNTSPKTGKVSRSTDKEVLHELSFQDDRVAKVRGYREALNNKTKFADALLNSADYNGDGRSRPSAILFGTYSGRLTYGSKQGKGVATKQTGFALHQEKRDKMYRNVIVAPPDHTLVEFDAAGQEFRWMAIASGDKTMLALCEPGEDPHSYMGAQVGGADYQQLIKDVHAEVAEAEATRKLGKVANLSLQYRTSARKLRVVARVDYGIPMELPIAQKIHRTYRTVYKGVPIYWDKQIAQTQRTGYVETLGGRRVQVTGNWNGTWGWSMGSTAINYRIQGTGADQKYLAMAALEPVMEHFDARFAWDLHDGIYMYVPDAKLDAFIPKARRALNNLPYRQAWGFTPPIPMPWDCKVGKAWGGLKERMDGH